MALPSPQPTSRMQGIKEVIRDAPFGQILRYITNNRILLYPEEQPNFTAPGYTTPFPTEKQNDLAIAPTTPAPDGEKDDPLAIHTPPLDIPDLSKTHSHASSSSNSDIERRNSTAEEEASIIRIKSQQYTPDRLREERALALALTKSRTLSPHSTQQHHAAIPIAPTLTSSNHILVTWYTSSDPSDPQNWSQVRKAWTAGLICAYTFVVYASSSIYVSSIPAIKARFGVGDFKASLGLALYVLGYGIGPLVFSPLSEVPQFGRNIPYVATFALYVILAVPASLVDNFGGLMVLRFLLGLFGSPCLASGGASMGDLYSLLYLPYPLALWVVAAFAAPALGPLLSGFSVPALNWRFSQWEILWMAGPVFILFLLFLPETQPTTILLQRAERLRKVTGNERIRSQTEVDNKGMTFGAMLLDAIVKPIEICIKDPAILFVNLYTALTYGIYYSFFEVFALVYPEIYGFNIGETSIVFTCIIVGCFIAVAIHFSYLKWYLIPDIMTRGLREQEHRLVPAIFASVGPTVGLFLFGWTAKASIHWIVGVIGITIYSASCFILLQCIFTYVPMSYPQYAASLFAGNDFCRSLFAFGAVLFSRPMYIDMGIGKGISILGGLSVIGIIGMYLLWHYGAKLRARSKFAI
ncbi:multidrug transporter [Paraphoma chrysanthemicola]|uniref:Multidrug transporter n=1 Tax=Paraphoma chrysanthemicola TaxID=798071 RepID=A0A8K0RJ93_9PLEO|nr:multidrug transporter [Paraphoma chrysanthemicola]